MRTVLVADDDADIRELIASKLEMAGYIVRPVADGRSALDAVRSGCLDLALLDIRMPGPTGVEICRQLRSDPATADLPVILVTAYAHDVDIKAGLAAGADDYIVKPFSPRELARRVRAFRNRGSAVG